MTLKAFLFLFAVAVVTVVCAAFIAERVFEPGFARGIMIAVLSGLVVFPAARWAEYRGWIKGDWSPGGAARKAAEAAKAAEKARAAEKAGAAEPARVASAAAASAAEPSEPTPSGSASAADRFSSSGDPR